MLNTRSLLLSLTLLGGLASAQTAPLRVSATTSIVAEFVKNVGGTRVQVNTIVPPGGDTHSFQPTTGAIRNLAGSKVLFANGAGLEPWLAKLSSSVNIPVMALTDGLKLRPVPQSAGHTDSGTLDPHAWWDADLAAGYVRNVQRTLTRLDPAGKGLYAQNAASFIASLQAADAYARKQFASLPANSRNIVTNHDALHYLAARYGLRIVGTVIPGLSTEREPSAREMASLVDNVRKAGAKAIFTENTVNARLAQTLAQETGAKIAPPLYTDALGPAGSAGATLLQAWRYNVDTIVKALR